MAKRNHAFISESVSEGYPDKVADRICDAIGVSKPLSVCIDTVGTGTVDEDRLSDVLQQLANLSQRGIRTHLGLNKPICARTAANDGFSWEKADLVNDLRKAF